MFRLRYAVALAAAVCLISPGVAQPAPTYTWAGTWTIDANTCCGKTPVPMTLDANGNGSYSFCGGTISGAQISGRTLKGTWTQQAGCANVAEPSGAVEFDMDATGKVFVGDWRYASHTNWDGPMNGTCTGGACLNNGAMPTQPPPAATPQQKPVGSAAHPLSRVTVNESGKVYFPHEATVKNGALVTVCDRNNFPAAPFSLSKYNEFPAGLLKMSNLKLIHAANLLPGQCMKFRAHNPTKSPINLTIYDAIHSHSRMVITVMPSA